MKTVGLDDVLHRRAKVAAASEGVTLGAWLTGCVEAGLAACTAGQDLRMLDTRPEVPAGWKRPGVVDVSDVQPVWKQG